MNEKEALDKVAEAIVSFDSEKLRVALDGALSSGVSVDQMITGGLGKGMEIVGERYEKGEYFLSDLIMSATIMNEALQDLKPMIEPISSMDKAKVIIGTVEGDLHDIGKNLVKYMLESAGYDVLDLGVDVAPRKFVEKTKEIEPMMVCISTLLSVTMSKVKDTIEAISGAGLRSTVKILVGGRCLTEEIAKTMGADDYGRDCFDGLRKAKALLRHS